MTDEYLSNCVYGRLAMEQKSFREWLLKQPAEEILNHAYEYAMREDLVYAMENIELSESQALALLASEAPLTNLYKRYLGLETDHMETMSNCIEALADDVESLFATIRTQPVYQHTLDYAVAHGEEKLYHDSFHANVACKNAIEKAIAQNYTNNCMDAIASKQVATQFGYDRTLYVLANTVHFKDWDARFSRANKDWAKNMPVAGGNDGRWDHRWEFVVEKSHPGLVDMFLTMVRSDVEIQNKQRVSVRKKLNQKIPSSSKTPTVKKSGKEVR